MTSITETEKEKAKLRKTILQKQREMSRAERTVSDEELFARLMGLSKWRAAKTVFLFVGTMPEPDTALLLPQLLSAGVRVAVPRSEASGHMEARQIKSTEQLKPGRFGIPEPDEACPVIKKEEIELTLVPALCYDRRGFRLGRGGGYYDRYLSGYTGISIGLCRECFLQDTLPTLSHDRRVDLVLTERETIACASNM